MPASLLESELDVPTQKTPSTIEYLVKKDGQPYITPTLWLLVFYSIGLILVVSPSFISLLRLIFLSKNRASEKPLEIWEKLYQKEKGCPPLYFTDSPSAPFTCGIFRYSAFLPTKALHWNERRLSSALIHEKTHLLRHDPPVRFCSLLIRSALWFHPLMWLAHQHLILTQEQVCDQAALEIGITSADYAEDLLRCVASTSNLPLASIPMASSQIEQRIQGVLSPIPNHSKPKAMIIKLSIITLILVIASLGFADPLEQSKTENPESSIKRDSVTNAIIRGEIFTRDGFSLATSNTLIGEKSTERYYPQKAVSAHLIGYVGEIDPTNPSKLKGKEGLEKTFNQSLAAGTDLTTTIDSTLQQIAYDALEKNDLCGAVVVSDPSSGAILALASYPSYDPNLMSPRISKERFSELISDPDLPLKNRATLGKYPLASTAQLLTAVASQHAGLGNPEIHCKGFIQFGNIKFLDWNRSRDETLTIPGALKTSCNTYFMQLALDTGVDSMKEMKNLFRLGQKNLSELNTSASSWMPNLAGNTPNSDKYLALVSLGTGRQLSSPIDVNAITSAIATGTWHKPHLVSNPNHSKFEIPLVGEGEITQEGLDLIRQGMVDVVNEKGGSARLAAIQKNVIAGKTGTAQSGSSNKNYGWFTGYAPAEQPKYSVTVILEKCNSGGKDAAPIAAEIFKFAFTPKEK